MTESEIRQAILDSIHEIAPEAEFESLDPGAELRDELDLDSMDFLNILVAIARRTGVEVPEEDYARLDTLERMVEYLRNRISERDREGSSPG
jgi:acyl carrier protein